MSTKALTIGIAAVLVAMIAIITLTAGGDHGDSANARETDGAFIVEMTPHHESAIEMANGEDSGIAQAIVAAQSGEIEEMNSGDRTGTDRLRRPAECRRKKKARCPTR